MNPQTLVASIVLSGRCQGKRIDASMAVNARIALTNIDLGAGPNVDLSLWSRNLLNEQRTFAKGANASARFVTGAINDPRTYGFDLTVRF